MLNESEVWLYDPESYEKLKPWLIKTEQKIFLSFRKKIDWTDWTPSVNLPPEFFALMTTEAGVGNNKENTYLIFELWAPPPPGGGGGALVICHYLQ